MPAPARILLEQAEALLHGLKALDSMVDLYQSLSDRPLPPADQEQVGECLARQAALYKELADGAYFLAVGSKLRGLDASYLIRAIAEFELWERGGLAAPIRKLRQEIIDLCGRERPESAHEGCPVMLADFASPPTLWGVVEETLTPNEHEVLSLLVREWPGRVSKAQIEAVCPDGVVATANQS
jgi:hypothetical protein